MPSSLYQKAIKPTVGQHLNKYVRREIERDVKRGAKILDRCAPVWANQKFVRMSTLNLQDGCDCVLGQLRVTLDEVSLDHLAHVMAEEGYIQEDLYEYPESLGFALNEQRLDGLLNRNPDSYAEIEDDAWAWLERCWIDAIRERRAS